MVWSDPTAHVYVDGEILSAPTFNTYINQDLLHLYQCSAAGVVRNRLVDTAADLSIASGTMSEIHGSLRCTITVPPSGRFRVTQSIVLKAAVSADALIGIAPLFGTFTVTSQDVPLVNLPSQLYSQTILGNQPPGLTTFVFGWASCCANQQIICPNHTRSGARWGTYMLIEPVP